MTKPSFVYVTYIATTPAPSRRRPQPTSALDTM